MNFTFNQKLKLNLKDFYKYFGRFFVYMLTILVSFLTRTKIINNYIGFNPIGTIEFSILRKLHIGPGMVLNYFTFKIKVWLWFYIYNFLCIMLFSLEIRSPQMLGAQPLVYIKLTGCLFY